MLRSSGGCLSSVQRHQRGVQQLQWLPQRSTLCRAGGGAGLQPHAPSGAAVSGANPRQQGAPEQLQPDNESSTLQTDTTVSSNSTGSPAGGLLPVACATAVGIAAWLLPGVAEASEGSFTGQSAQLFEAFLDQVTALGPWGGVLFVTVVMLFEMVPLFPTQPLSLASGLLFGADKGALLMLMGVTLAATNAFLIARGVGRPLAQKVIDAEMSHAEGGEGGAVAKTMANVQTAIEGGGFWKQLTAIFLLRLTPVVPFSASNYLLGLTPVQVPAFVGGTVLGMSVWSVLYASLGGASRKLLDRGADIETLLADLGDKASALSSNIVYFTVAVSVAGLLLWLVKSYAQWPSNEDGALTSRDDLPQPGEQPVWLSKRSQVLSSSLTTSQRRKQQQQQQRSVETSDDDEPEPWLGSTWSLLTRSLSPQPEDEAPSSGRAGRNSGSSSGSSSNVRRDKVKVPARAQRSSRN